MKRGEALAWRQNPRFFRELPGFWRQRQQGKAMRPERASRAWRQVRGFFRRFRGFVATGSNSIGFRPRQGKLAGGQTPRSIGEPNMTRHRYRCPIPAQAKRRILKKYEDGSVQCAGYYLDGNLVGRRYWDEEGDLYLEYGIKKGKKHGREYWFGIYPNSQPNEMTPYRNGLPHGTAMQFDEKGEVLVISEKKKGVGLDLWCDNLKYTLAEEQYDPAEGEVGYRRHWNEDEKTIYEEYYFTPLDGYHGVWRAWNERGRLKRGFPRYYIRGNQVTKRHYLKACTQDHTLRAYRKADDSPKRELPQEYLAQRRRRK